jgi:glycerophosphoryl diester phosphodiesterase
VPAAAARLHLVDRRLVTAAHRRGIAVEVWTINSRTEMIRLLDLGVDGIMTDRADLLREVLQERGQWRQ